MQEPPRGRHLLEGNLRKDTLWKLIVLCTVASLAFAGIAAGSGKEELTCPRATNRVKVAGIVLKWMTGNCKANYERAETLIRTAAGEGARIVCTPESFLDGYVIRDPDLTEEQFLAVAEPIPTGFYFRKLLNLANELNIYLIAGISELDEESVFNSATLIGPDGKLKGTYRKKHLWADEIKWYSAGTSFPAFDTIFGKIGIMICSDRRKPAAIKELIDNGAVIVFCPAGGGYGEENDRIVSRRSQEGGVPIVFVHPIEFLVTDTDGSILVNDLYGETLDDFDGSDPGVVRYYSLPLQ